MSGIRLVIETKYLREEISMLKRIKTKWLKALRSGKYRQVKGAMRRGILDNEKTFGYCCLGVLTDLYCKEIGKDFEDVRGGCCYLPNTVQEWAGLERNDPLLCNSRKYGELSCSSANDGETDFSFKPRTFKQIAVLIERHL